MNKKEEIKLIDNHIMIIDNEIMRLKKEISILNQSEYLRIKYYDLILNDLIDLDYYIKIKNNLI